MTVQISDEFRWNGKNYELATVNRGRLLEPGFFRLRPVASCSACWRGYFAVFGISQDHLVLEDLHVNLDKGDETAIRAAGRIIESSESESLEYHHEWFNRHFLNMGFKMSYTGGLLIVRDYISELRAYGGNHEAWKYSEVVELAFHQGQLIHESDRSREIEKIREQILLYQEYLTPEVRPSKEELDALVKSSFTQRFGFCYDDMTKQIHAERVLKETASIIVRPRSSKDTQLIDFKIYLDRNVRGSFRNNLKPDHQELIEMEPGEHTLTVRDYDHLAEDRRETNTIKFKVAEYEQIIFELLLVDGQLALVQMDQ